MAYRKSATTDTQTAGEHPFIAQPFDKLVATRDRLWPLGVLWPFRGEWRRIAFCLLAGIATLLAFHFLVPGRDAAAVRVLLATCATLWLLVRTPLKRPWKGAAAVVAREEAADFSKRVLVPLSVRIDQLLHPTGDGDVVDMLTSMYRPGPDGMQTLRRMRAAEQRLHALMRKTRDYYSTLLIRTNDPTADEMRRIVLEEVRSLRPLVDELERAPSQ